MKIITRSSLCESCQGFQIERLFRGFNPKESERTTDDIYPYHKFLAPRRCGLCDFFIDCLPERCKARGADGTWSICMDSVSPPDMRDSAKILVWCYPPITQEESLGYLQMNINSNKRRGGNGGIEVAPIVCIPSGSLQTYKLEPATPVINFAPVSEWLDRDNFTKQACEYKEEGSLSAALTVIDCTTSTLVPLVNGEHYATLSYVWGRPAQPPLGGTNSNRLPLSLPNTIQDSIDVCNKLNIRYLWVDRYCISHDNEHLRSLQIRRMDKIYRNSFLTIVACAGGDPDYGLPGLSKLRKPNPCIKVLGLGCLQALSQSIKINSSIWATRAWTYQEALLSQRQLYFTDNEIFLGSVEGLQKELGTDSNGCLERLLPTYSRTGSSVGAYSVRESSRKKYLLRSLHIWECIDEYSTRDLSYQTDILNAFSGILAFYRQEDGTHHLWGLPFTGAVTRQSQLSVLSFEMSLRWVLIGPPHRREGFPSWSWTGWNNQVRYVIQDLDSEFCTTKENAMEITVELISGRLLNWSEYQDNYPNLQDYSQAHTPRGDTDRPSRFIYVSAFTSLIVEKDMDNSGVQYYSIEALTMVTGQEFFSSAEILSDNKEDAKSIEDFPMGSLLALHFLQADSTRISGGFRTKRYSFQADRCALLVRNVGDHWERVCLLGSEKSLEREDVHTVRRKIRLG